MEELISTFHIDWKLMIAQIVNFAIVFFVLWKFAFKPLSKTLAERSKTIEKSLKDAVDIEHKLSKTNEDTKAQLAMAQSQATEMLEKGKAQAEVKRQEILENAKKEVEDVISRAKEQIEQEKVQMIEAAKSELADMVINGVRRVVDKELDSKLEKKVVKGQLNRL